MASYSVSNIQDIARERYNAVGDQFFSDKMLYDLIFSAQDELAKEGWLIEKTLSTVSVNGTRNLAYPEHTLAIKEVKYDYEKLYKSPLRVDPKTSTNDPSGTPTNYSIWQNEIILYPTPDEDDKNIQIRIYKYPDIITSNTDPIEVPQEYRDDIINFCLAHMVLKDKNINLHQIYMNLWLRTVEKAKDQRRRRLRADRPARVRDEYFGEDIAASLDYEDCV